MDILSYVLGFNKGKTQGGSGAIKKDILPTEVVNFSKNMGDTYTGYFSGIFALKAGNTYYVEWDGETYKCEAFAHTDALYSYVSLGNCSKYGGSSNDEPFTISITLESLTRMVIALKDDKATHTISIYQIIGGSADIDIKPLTITENGTYTAPDGEAYSPITVDVPSSGVIETDIFPPQTVSGFEEDAGDFPGSSTKTLNGQFVINANETYYVEWDGKTYTCRGTYVEIPNGDEMMSYVYIGDGSRLGYPGNDEPFAMIRLGETSIIIVIALDSLATEHNIHIYQKVSSGTSADERVKYVTFMYGAQELEKYPVIVGDTVRDRAKDNGWAEDTEKAGWVENPLIPSTDTKIYPVIGWSSADDATSDGGALENVTEDRTVYAVVMEKARKYAANFFDDEGKLIVSQRVAYGTKAISPNTFRDGYTFEGWALSDGTISTNLVITADTDFYGVWELDLGWLIPMEFSDTYSDVRYAHYRPDGKRLYFAAGNKLYTYDTETQPYTLISTLNIHTTSTCTAYCMAVSPDGKWLAVGHNGTKSATINNTVRLYNISGSTPSVVTLPSTAKGSSTTTFVNAVAFSGDSSRLALILSTDMFVFDCTSAASPSSWTYTKISIGTTIAQLAVDATGQKIAVLPYDSSKALKLLDASNEYTDVVNACITESNYNHGYSSKGAGTLYTYSPNGRYLAMATNIPKSDSLTLRVYDTGTTSSFYKKVLEVTTPTNGAAHYVTGVSFSADSSLLAVSRFNSPYVQVYDTSTWTLKENPLSLPSGSANCCALGSNNHLFVGLIDSPGTMLYRVKK